MAQAHNPFGLRVDTSLTSGQLSLHEYRKFLSRPDAAVNMTPASPQPRLRRKPAALHLCQRGHHGFGSQFQSPASSAPSSPPPLSYTQSVVSFSGELQTPISPISISRPFSQPVSAISSRRVDPYSTRQRNSKRGLTVRHSRNVSDISLPSTSSGVLKVKHDGTEFEILNPKGAMLPINTDPLYRISNDSRGTMEHESPGTSRSQSFVSYGIPEDVIRPISASESAVLSRYTSPAPFLEQQQQPDSSFAALPPLQEASLQPPSPMSPKTPSRTLKEKVSRLFGSSEKRLSWKGDIAHYEKQGLSQVRDGNAPSSPRVERWNAGDITKPTPQPATSVTSSTQQSTPRESEDSKIRRRPSPRGPHSANRHQTLADALEQPETENNGLTFENIMRYIGTDDGKQSGLGDGETRNQDNTQVERPWQPDTWAEPTRSRMPHNRPSDSNLSITAPSTRASIRPYVERAAAFMAKGGAISISSSSSSSSLLSDPEKELDNGHVRLINESEDEPTAPLRRTISRRARPLSSNPPDLDAPILHDSAHSSSETFEPLMSAYHFSRPQLVMHHSPTSQVRESPHIPPRHPNHRLIRFDSGISRADTPVTANAVSIIPSPGIPPGVTPIPESATVTTIVAAPKKRSKRHVSGCRCI